MLNSLAERLLAWLLPKKKPEKNEWVTAGISFLLAVTLWFLVTMNTQNYSTTFRVPLKLTNFPDSLQLLNEFPPEMEVYTRGVGIDLLYQHWEPEDTVYVDFKEWRQERQFVARENLSSVDQVLKSGITPVGVEPDTIFLDFLRKTNKRVPIELDLVLNLPTSYRLRDEPRADRDSVLVIGPADSLARITSWKTTHYVSDQIRDEQELFIPLDTLHPFQVLPKIVPVRVLPLPYTERTISVPIRRINLPRNKSLRLENDSVRVQFLLPMDDYDRIDASAFRIDADYELIDARSDYLIPQLSAAPASVRIRAIAPRLVRYTVIEKE
ncbi:MAG: hypothetical protein AAGN35_15830 [Bacteroidota bacterium]